MKSAALRQRETRFERGAGAASGQFLQAVGQRLQAAVRGSDTVSRQGGHEFLVVLSEVYAAGEEPIPGVSGARLHEAVRACGHRDAWFVPDRSKLAQTLGDMVREGDLVLTLGAGDITHLGEELLALLGGARA